MAFGNGNGGATALLSREKMEQIADSKLATFWFRTVIGLLSLISTVFLAIGGWALLSEVDQAKAIASLQTAVDRSSTASILAAQATERRTDALQQGVAALNVQVSRHDQAITDLDRRADVLEAGHADLAAKIIDFRASLTGLYQQMGHANDLLMYGSPEKQR